MPRRSFALLFAMLLAPLTAGCNRHDAEALGRIGKKIGAHAKSSAGDVGAKIDLSWAGKREPSLQDKVADRLRFENTLAGVPFEVNVKGKEVELKAVVKNALQRQRALELAETVSGVEKVNDAIVVRDD